MCAAGGEVAWYRDTVNERSRYGRFASPIRGLHGPHRHHRRRPAGGDDPHQRRQEFGHQADGGEPADRPAAAPHQHAAAGRHALPRPAAAPAGRRGRGARRARTARRPCCTTPEIDSAPSRPTTWSARCAPRSTCWARCWPAPARPRCRLPGGCAIGARPVDLHLKALEALGAHIDLHEGYVYAQAPRGLKGADIEFPIGLGRARPSTRCWPRCWPQGVTVIGNAAREPEIDDLADCLNAMGAKVEGAGTPMIRIIGVAQLHGATHAVMPDRIETGTYAAGRGHGRRRGAPHQHPRRLDRGAARSRWRRPASTSSAPTTASPSSATARG